MKVPHCGTVNNPRKSLPKYKEGKIKAIGVSNFYADRYLDLAYFSEIKPAVNQIEAHVFNQQAELQEIMKKYDTKLMSWGPLAEGKNDFFNNIFFVFFINTN